jgi:hypothetical protein
MLGGPPKTGRPPVEDLPRIDIHRMRREGLVGPGATAITIVANGIKQTLRLGVRRGEFGGEIVLLHCPRCDSRRWHVYVLEGEVGCRGCLRLIHACSLGRGMSAMAPIRRLREKLGADPVPFSPLPPRKGRVGRNAALYDRLASAIQVAEGRALAALDAATARGVRVCERERQRRNTVDAGGASRSCSCGCRV